MPGEHYPEHELLEASGRQSEEPGKGESAMRDLESVDFEFFDLMASEEVIVNGIATRVFFSPIGESQQQPKIAGFRDSMREVTDRVRAAKPRIAEILREANDGDNAVTKASS